MDPLRLLESFVYVLSTSLFYPVLLGLVAFVAWLALSAGSMGREALQRRRDPDLGVRRWRETMDRHMGVAADQVRLSLEGECESIVTEAEAAAAVALDRVRFAVRVAPSLGLMGTLIPMATALASLAGGDLPGLATSMVTAFATTVVGLAVGTGAYGLFLIRNRWTSRDLDRVRHHADVLCHQASKPARNGPAPSRAVPAPPPLMEKIDALPATSARLG